MVARTRLEMDIHYAELSVVKSDLMERQKVTGAYPLK